MIEIVPCRFAPQRFWTLGAASFSAGFSFLLHGTAAGAFFAAGWFWGESILEPTRFAGRQRVVRLDASFSPAVPPPSAEVEQAVEVVIEPTVARIEHHHFRQVTHAEVAASPRELPLLETAEVRVEVDPQPLERQEATAPPEHIAETKPAPQLQRTRSTAAPSFAQAAAVPQVLGNESHEPPRFFNNRPPTYPEAAQRQGWHGTVYLRLIIAADGGVTSVTLHASSGFPLLDAEAINAVRQWKAHPAKRGGRATATEEVLPVRFVLR